MSRLSRALRAISLSDKEAQREAEDKAYPMLLQPRPYEMSALTGEVRKIAESLARLERRKRRPRVVMCEHPELHAEEIA